MSTASTSGLGRKKKSPGLMDQISKLLSGGDKKKRSKGSFRGLAASPQTGSSRRKPAENAVVQFFRSIVSSPHPSPKSRSDSLLLDDFETARLFMSRRWPHHVLRVPSHHSDVAETKAHSPESSTWEKPSPVHPPNAGAPSFEPSTEEPTTDPNETGQDGENGKDLRSVDSQHQDMLTN